MLLKQGALTGMWVNRFNSMGQKQFKEIQEWVSEIYRTYKFQLLNQWAAPSISN